MRRFTPLALKAGVSLALVTLLLYQVNTRGENGQGLAQLAQLLARADLPLLLLGLLAALASWAVNTYKWQRLLRVLGAPHSYGFLLALNFVGLFYSVLLPGQIAGEVMKGVRLARTGERPAFALLSIGLDRVTGVLALGLGGVIGLLLAPSVELSGIMLLVCGGAFLAAAAPLVLAVLRPFPGLRWPQPSGKLRPLYAAAAALWASVEAYSRTPGSLLLAAAHAIVCQALVTLGNYFAARSVGVDLPPLALLWIVAAVSLVHLVPSLGGLGVRELAYTSLLAQYGIPAPHAAALAVAVLLVILIQALIGGGVELFWSRVARSAAVTAAAD